MPSLGLGRNEAFRSLDRGKIVSSDKLLFYVDKSAYVVSIPLSKACFRKRPDAEIPLPTPGRPVEFRCRQLDTSNLYTCDFCHWEDVFEGRKVFLPCPQGRRRSTRPASRCARRTRNAWPKTPGWRNPPRRAS